MNNDQKFRIAIGQLVNQWTRKAKEHENVYKEEKEESCRIYAETLRDCVSDVNLIFASLPNVTGQPRTDGQP